MNFIGSGEASPTNSHVGVIEALRVHGPLPRSELAEKLGLSRAALTKISAAMIQIGALRETGTAPLDGARKRGQPLALRGEFGYTAGVQLRDEHVDVIAMDFAGVVRAVSRHDVDRSIHPRDFLVRAWDAVRSTFRSAGIRESEVLGIGIALPGLVDHARGVSRWVPGFPSWSDAPLQSMMEEISGLPTLVSWRAYAAATGELWWGAHRRERDFVFVNVDNGVGMAIVNERKVIRGHQGFAGMIGHLPIPGGTRRCVCGNRGCLQTIVSVPALIHQVVEAQLDGVNSVLTRIDPPRQVTFADLVEAAEARDPLALRIFDEAADALAVCLAAIVHLLNPPVIVIGGALAQAKPVIADSLRRGVERRLLGPDYQAVKLAFSGLTPDSATVGSATMILDAVLPALFRSSSAARPAVSAGPAEASS